MYLLARIYGIFFGFDVLLMLKVQYRRKIVSCNLQSSLRRRRKELCKKTRRLRRRRKELCKKQDACDAVAKNSAKNKTLATPSQTTLQKKGRSRRRRNELCKCFGLCDAVASNSANVRTLATPSQASCKLQETFFSTGSVPVICCISPSGRAKSARACFAGAVAG